MVTVVDDEIVELVGEFNQNRDLSKSWRDIVIPADEPRRILDFTVAVLLEPRLIQDSFRQVCIIALTYHERERMARVNIIMICHLLRRRLML